MRKQIDLPNNMIPALKRIAKKDLRSVKSWMEHLIITEIVTRTDQNRQEKTK